MSNKIAIEKVVELFDFAVSKSTKKIDVPEWFGKFQELFKTSINNKKKAEKDPKAPKKPLTSYIIFCTEKRKSIVDKDPKMAPKDVSRKLAELWRALSENEKAVYSKKAEAEKERYQNEMKNYSSSSDDDHSEHGDDHNDHSDHSDHEEEKKVEKKKPASKKVEKKVEEDQEEPQKEEPKKKNDKSEKVEKKKEEKDSKKKK